MLNITIYINYTNLCAELVSNPRLEWWCVEAKLDTSAEQCVVQHYYNTVAPIYCIIMYIIMYTLKRAECQTT